MDIIRYKYYNKYYFNYVSSFLQLYDWVNYVLKKICKMDINSWPCLNNKKNIKHYTGNLQKLPLDNVFSVFHSQ